MPPTEKRYKYKSQYEFTTSLGEKFVKTYYWETFLHRVVWEVAECGFIDSDWSSPGGSKSYNCRFIVDIKEVFREKEEMNE